MENLHTNTNRQRPPTVIMKKIAIMQPYLFPYLGYFQLINAVNEYVIYDDVQFMKRGRINRNSILMNGQKWPFTISISGASTTKLINEVEIKDDFQKFEKTIAMAYNKAPYKAQACKLIHAICSYENKNLACFIGNSIKEIANYLEIDTKLLYSSGLNKKSNLKGQKKIIAICKELKACTYINSIGGQGLYNKGEFKGNDLELKFLKPVLKKYKQLDNEFVPHLSIIDVMMFNSPAEIRKMLNDYELI